MKHLLIITFFITFISCSKNNNNVIKFKTGTFKTTLRDSDITSIAIRNDSIQVETYNKVKDTFSIKWNSNFEYVLLKLNPKNRLDSTPFIVKITKFSGNSYSFKAHYKGSNFKQNGAALKIK